MIERLKSQLNGKKGFFFYLIDEEEIDRLSMCVLVIQRPSRPFPGKSGNDCRFI